MLLFAGFVLLACFRVRLLWVVLCSVKMLVVVVRVSFSLVCFVLCVALLFFVCLLVCFRVISSIVCGSFLLRIWLVLLCFCVLFVLLCMY